MWLFQVQGDSMRFLLILISICSIVVAQVKFSPIIFLNYLSSGSDFQPSNNEIKIFGAGLKIKYKAEKLNISAKFINHRLYGSSSRYSLHNFNSNKGLSWGQDSDQSEDSFDYDFADLDVRYEMSNGEFFFGKMNPQWGAGHSELILSDKSPSFPLFGFNWKVNDKVSMEYFHGELKSGIKDSIYAQYYIDAGDATLIPSRSFNIKRNIAAHKFELKLNEKLKFIGSETVIYAIRGVDSHYLLPFIPFWSLQHYLGDTDNIQMAGELIFSPNTELKFYGTIYMDEWAPDKTLDDDNRNWFSYQAGFAYNNIFSKKDKLILEYTWTDNRVYHHRFSINDYYSHDYPLGFWAGPHAEELYISYNINFLDMDWMIKLSDAKRGKFINLENQYDSSIEDPSRYEGQIEEKLFIELLVKKPLYKDLYMTFGGSYVDWRNAGFDPTDSNSQNLQDIQKASFNLSFNYNY